MNRIRIALLSLCCLPLAAQTGPVADIQFHPQGINIGQYAEYRAVICNPSEITIMVDSGSVANTARSGWHLSLVSYERVEQAEAKQTEPSRWVLAGRVVQALGIGFTVADQAGLWKIGTDEKPARWKALIPLIGLGVPPVVDWLAKNKPASEVTPEQNRLPRTFTVAGRVGAMPACQQYIVYAVVAE